MSRITQANLEGIILRLNKLTGNPITSYTQNGDKFTANPGNYHLEGYGNSLIQMSNSGGATSLILSGESKSDLYYQIHAMIKGVEIGYEKHKEETHPSIR